MFSLSKQGEKIILTNNKTKKTYPIEVDEIDYIIGDDNKLRNDSIIERYIQVKESKDEPIKMISKEADLKKEYKEAEKKGFSNVGVLIDNFIHKYNLTSYDLKILSEIPDEVGVRKLKKNDVISRNMMYDLRDLKKKIKEEDQTIADSFNYMKSYLKNYLQDGIVSDERLLEFIQNPNNYEGIYKQECKNFTNFIDVVNSGCDKVGDLKVNIIRRHRDFIRTVKEIVQGTDLHLWSSKAIEKIGKQEEWKNQMVMGYNSNINKKYVGCRINSNYIIQLRTELKELSQKDIFLILGFIDVKKENEKDNNIGKKWYSHYENIEILRRITSTMNVSPINVYNFYKVRNPTSSATYITIDVIKNLDGQKMVNGKMEVEDEDMKDCCDAVNQIIATSMRFKQSNGYEDFKGVENISGLSDDENSVASGWTDDTLTRIENISETLKQYGGASASGWTDDTLTRIENISETLKQYGGRFLLGEEMINSMNKLFNKRNHLGKQFKISSGWSDDTLTRIENISETLKQYE